MRVALIVGLGAALGGGDRMPDGRPTPSGFEVPRWVSLKSSPVRARYGPGLDHRILWEYRAAGLPVQVVAETREWRKICDPQGNVAWVHRTVTTGRRTVYVRGEGPIDLRGRPDDDAGVRARLRPQALAGLDECEDGWCRLQVGRAVGWAPRRALFGVQDAPLCDAASPAGRRAPG